MVRPINITKEIIKHSSIMNKHQLNKQNNDWFYILQVLSGPAMRYFGKC
jgi:hypothetical protein